MEDLIRNRGSKRRATSALGTALLLLASAVNGAANMPKLDDDLTYSADVVSSDFRHDTLELSGNVRATQGPMSIEAQTAKARDFRAPNSRWTFEQAVRIRSDEADLQSNLATAKVVNGQLSDVRIEGSPARFEQIAAVDNRQVRGRAGVIEYDVKTGVVKLTNQVWFSNGKNEVRGDEVIYNVRDERMQVRGSSNRVRGIIRPNENKSQTNAGGGTGGTAAIVEPTFNENGEKLDNERIEPQLAAPKLATDNNPGGGA